MRPIHVVTAALFFSAGALAACNVVLGLDDLKDQVDSGSADAGDGDSGDGGVDAAPSCASYCASINNLCGFGDPQYIDIPTCLAMCATFPVGTSSLGGNTLLCRLANLKPDACASAGPYSPSCGGEAADFCALYEASCGDAGYGADCPDAFAALPYALDAGLSFLPENHGSTRTCREYYLELGFPGSFCDEASRASALYGCR